MSTDNSKILLAKNKQLDALLQVAVRLTSETDLNTLLDLIVKTTNELLNSERATVFLVNEEEQSISSRIGIGLEKTEIRFSINEGIAGFVARTGEILIIDDPYSHPDFNKQIDIQTGFKTRNILCAPMQNLDKKIIGVFQVLNKRADNFSEDDKELLLALASISAAAIENARLIEERNRQLEELKKAYDELQAAQETIIRQEKLATIGQLASGISHEIRSQLTVVSAVSGIRRLHPDDEKVKTYTGLILEARNRIVSILDEIRDFSKKKEYVKQSHNLNSIIENVVELCSFDKDLDNITLNANLNKSAPPEVYVNSDKIKQVLINLIRNAGHASPPKSTITIEVETSADNQTIIITDQGSGIPDEIAQHIWEPFFTTKKQGMGLGLDICKRIIESHNGKIWFETEVGRGTTFFVQLSKSKTDSIN
ncbi:MAG: GAF domain-containing protein [Bacteroidetes bacterium]|nr:GAF domain-containing protein [Bacteroidota bacterium]